MTVGLGPFFSNEAAREEVCLCLAEFYLIAHSLFDEQGESFTRLQDAFRGFAKLGRDP